MTDMLTLDGSGPLYEQVYKALRAAILAAALNPGARLPSSRSLAAELGVSRNVVVIAFEQLLAEGYVQARIGSGTYVAESLSALPQRPRSDRLLQTTAQPRLSAWGQRLARQAPVALLRSKRQVEIDFRYGFAPPDPDLLRQWRRSVVRSFDRYPLDYAQSAGDPALRRALAQHLRLHRGVVCEPDQILVVGGSQQALDLAARVLIDPGDSVIMEDPHYQGARAIFQAAGAHIIGLPVDAEGIDLSPRQGAAESDARLAYVTPSHQFPTGAVMSLTRRLALLDWAERHDAFVLEDDYDSEFRYAGRPIEAIQGLDQRGRTLYMGTLSKVMFPALRLGFLVLPYCLLETFRVAKWLADRHSPVLEQIALADFINSGNFERHLRRMRRRHAARRQALIDALDYYLGDQIEVMGTHSGIHLVIWLNTINATQVAGLELKAAEAGVGLYSIAPYYLSPPKRAGFLMGFGALEAEQITEGVRRLADVLRVYQKR